jgi:hypothetical protein
VESTKMSVVKMDIKEVKKIPILLGEVDIIKAIQLLPGVQAAGDGNTLFIVRGGNVDHNLVQLDEAVVYNPSHVVGFFSVFNGDAIKDFEIYSCLVNKNGYIVFDDYHCNTCTEVKPAVNFIVSNLKKDEFEVIGSLPNTFNAFPESFKSSNCFVLRKK